MVKWNFLILSATICFLVGESRASNLENDVTEFSIKLYKELAKRNEENIAYSGISVQTILALISQGARGSTASQLESALLLNNHTHTEISKYFHETMSDLDYLPPLNVELANKLYVANGFQIKPEFKKTAVEDFQSFVENVDFSTRKETASKINSWIEDRTHGKIKDIIQESQLNDLTRLVLVNTLYFNGSWLKPFDIDATEKRDFHISKTETVKVDTMRLTTNLPVYKSTKFGSTIIKLPYENKEVSMYIIYHDGVDGLKVKDETIDQLWTEMNLTTQYVKLYLPKFRVESTIDMIPVLQKMGVTDLFSSGNADLTGITDDKGLYVSSVTQKTFVDVNEFGTEAAAATALTAEDRILRDPKEQAQEIRVDRPFVYVILHGGVELIAGRVNKL